MIKRLAAGKRILVCVGPGGVGKTTIAAALGVVAARAGRRTLVATIDPAPRLADALGVPELSAEPRRLADEALRALGVSPGGTLLAARLDTAAAFRRLVERQVAEPAMRARIFDNPIYVQITSTLTGSQEYAAMLALHDLHETGRYDLIVLDTPPTAHALDFLDAPRRIAAAITSPAIQWFARVPASGRRLSWRRLREGPAIVLRRFGKLVGSQFLDDLGAFLLDFRDVLAGFLTAAHAIEALLRRPDSAFLLVLAPEVPAVNEALFFSTRLRSAGVPHEGFVVNRVLDCPGTTLAAELRAGLARIPTLGSLPSPTLDDAAQELGRVASYVDRLAQAQRKEIARLAHGAPGIDITTIPLLAKAPSAGLPRTDTSGWLRAIGDHLEGGGSRT